MKKRTGKDTANITHREVDEARGNSEKLQDNRGVPRTKKMLKRFLHGAVKEQECRKNVEFTYQTEIRREGGKSGLLR